MLVGLFPKIKEEKKVRSNGFLLSKDRVRKAQATQRAVTQRAEAKECGAGTSTTYSVAFL